ncbi:hypothetical protein A0128_03785 [Leptospira tipperaryensis]|uniref:Uncharacterized protein n=1 Tax=Leptospira tipperaryensis TaxID=2564040 RepID=A0A1D7UU24_9LEPT|nr:hypothetical protein A0128_03785 [Leptospira tipperaryensis]
MSGIQIVEKKISVVICVRKNFIPSIKDSYSLGFIGSDKNEKFFRHPILIRFFLRILFDFIYINLFKILNK